jgi:hypothetical protein
MRIAGFILCFFICLAGYGQKYKTQKIILHNSQLQSFISQAANLRFIRFQKDDATELQLQPDTADKNTKALVYSNWYSTVYRGHIYLFEKKFGQFPKDILLTILDSLRHKSCDYNWFEGVIFPDRVEIDLTVSCPTKSRDRIFIKVENHCEFFGGSGVFQQFVQDRLSCTNYKSFIMADTALFFTAVVKKDSLCHEVKFSDTVSSPLREIIQHSLTNTKGWKPYVKDGRNMSAWLQIFIYIQKDGAIEADYFH